MTMLDYESVIAHCEGRYGVRQERLWERFPDYAVFRHPETGKWFALLMKVDPVKFDLPAGPYVDVVNVKCDPFLEDGLVQRPGFYRAYHMNKRQWLSIILDGTVADEEITSYIDSSYELTF